MSPILTRIVCDAGSLVLFTILALESEGEEARGRFGAEKDRLTEEVESSESASTETQAKLSETSQELHTAKAELESRQAQIRDLETTGNEVTAKLNAVQETSNDLKVQLEENRNALDEVMRHKANV